MVLEKGPLARALQESVGDVIFNIKGGEVWSAEIKVEEDNKYGNFFLETWSNKNLADRSSYIDRGNNPGWIYKVKSRLLLYYFLSQDDLYVFDLFRLKQWAFGHDPGNNSARLFQYPERSQGKRQQMNDTWGRCVPIEVLRKAVGFKRLNPKQLPLFDEEPFFPRKSA